MKNNYLSLSIFFLFSCITTKNYTQAQQSTYLTIETQVIKYANNDCNGSFEIFTTDGVMPFTYSIDGGKTFHENKVFEHLCEGKYFVQVKDAAGKLGLTLMQLTPNTVTAMFNEAEQEAIRQNTIKDLLKQREAVMDNWEKRRNIEYKLSRLNITYPPIIVNENIVADTIHLTFKTIVPDGINLSVLYDHYDRMLKIFNDHIIDIKMDANELTTTIIYKSNFPDSKLNDFFNLNGFSNFK